MPAPNRLPVWRALSEALTRSGRARRRIRARSTSGSSRGGGSSLPVGSACVGASVVRGERVGEILKAGRGAREPRQTHDGGSGRVAVSGARVVPRVEDEPIVTLVLGVRVVRHRRSVPHRRRGGSMPGCDLAGSTDGGFRACTRRRGRAPARRRTWHRPAARGTRTPRPGRTPRRFDRSAPGFRGSSAAAAAAPLRPGRPRPGRRRDCSGPPAGPCPADAGRRRARTLCPRRPSARRRAATYSTAMPGASDRGLSNPSAGRLPLSGDSGLSPSRGTQDATPRLRVRCCRFFVAPIPVPCRRANPGKQHAGKSQVSGQSQAGSKLR